MDWQYIRLIAFFGILISVIAVQFLWPRRKFAGASLARTVSNIVMFLINAALTRALLAVTAFAAAIWAQSKGWGIFNAVEISPILAGVLTFIALDFALWVQHVATHKIPVLWRLHRVHHTDTAMDVTTGLRFHPAEIGLSLLYKSAVVIALGAPVTAIIIFEIVLNGAAMFSHGNIRLPKRVDSVLTKVIITPDFHLVHHSVLPEETDSNYANFLTLWDRIFRTRRWRSQEDLQTMPVGIEVLREAKDQTIWPMLIQPLYPLSGHDLSKSP